MQSDDLGQGSRLLLPSGLSLIFARNIQVNLCYSRKMANNSSPSSSPTKIIRFIGLAVLLMIIGLIYLLRHRPSPPSPPTLQATPLNPDSAEVHSSPAAAKPIALKKRHELAILGLT